MPFLIRLPASTVQRAGPITTTDHIHSVVEYNIQLYYKSLSRDEIPERDVTYIILSVYLLTLIDR